MKSYGGWEGMWGNLDPHEARTALHDVTPGTLMGWDSENFRGGLGIVIAVTEIQDTRDSTKLDREITVMFAFPRAGTKSYTASTLNPQCIVPLFTHNCKDPRLDKRFGGNRHQPSPRMVG